MKAADPASAIKLEDIPKVGSRMAADFRRLGIEKPSGLKGKDAYSLYREMCRMTGMRQDPCVLDSYMAAIDFMNGAPARPWYEYTPERKRQYPNI